MERLSDEEIEKRAEKYKGLDYDASCEAAESMKEIRDYYDAQINKQAKTMEELERIFMATTYDCKKAREHADKVGFGYDTTKEFQACISFYLAAGGTIKEGE